MIRMQERLAPPGKFAAQVRQGQLLHESASAGST